jgi:hypothetical protein
MWYIGLEIYAIVNQVLKSISNSLITDWHKLQFCSKNRLPARISAVANFGSIYELDQNIEQE